MKLVALRMNLYLEVALSFKKVGDPWYSLSKLSLKTACLSFKPYQTNGFTIHNRFEGRLSVVGRSVQKAPVWGSWFYVIFSDKPKYRRICKVMANVQKFNFASNIVIANLSEVKI